MTATEATNISNEGLNNNISKTIDTVENTIRERAKTGLTTAVVKINTPLIKGVRKHFQDHGFVTFINTDGDVFFAWNADL